MAGSAEILMVQFKQGRGAVQFDGDGDMGEMVLWFGQESFETARRILEKHAGSMFLILVPDCEVVDEDAI